MRILRFWAAIALLAPSLALSQAVSVVEFGGDLDPSSAWNSQILKAGSVVRSVDLACDSTCSTTIPSGLAFTVDTVAANAAGMTVLLTGQATQANNGPYVVGSSTWTRATNFVGPIAQNSDVVIIVRNGLTYKGSGWMLSTTSAVTIGSTAQVWQESLAPGGGGIPSIPTAQFLANNTGTTTAPSGYALPFLTPEWNNFITDEQGASVSLTASGSTTLTVPSPLFSSTDCQGGSGCTGTGNKVIVISGAGADLLAGANTGTITAGSGYDAGGTATYSFVPLTCVSCADARASQAYATITVTSGAVTAVNVAAGSGQKGYDYTVGDVLTTPNTFLGGSGSGFHWTLTTTAQAPLRTTITAFTSSTQVTLGAAMNSHLSSYNCGGATCQVYITWGMASGTGGVNDAGAKINAAFASNSTVRLNKGYYAIGTTIVPPATGAFHLICDPGAVLIAMAPLTGADAAMQGTPYNAMMTIDYPPTVSASGSFGSNGGSTIEGCTFNRNFIVKDGIVDRSFKVNFTNDFVNNGWGGTTTATGAGAGLSILNHGQGSLITGLNFNDGSTTLPGQATAVSQSITSAHCISLTDTDVQVIGGYCNAYGDSSVDVSGTNTMTATTSSGSPNLVVASMTGALHIGDRISDNSSYIAGGQGFIPASAYIIDGPVNGRATPFFTTVITSGSASIATSTQSLVAGEKVIFVAGGSGATAMGTITGLVPGAVYYANSTGLTSTTVQLCAQPSCAAGSIVPAGGGTATPIGQGVYSGTSGTFIMSANATGTSSGSDTVKTGEVLIASGCSGTGATSCFQSYGGSAPHFLAFHSFQAAGATAYGPCWQIDVSVAMLPATDQCDNQAAIADGVNARFASDYISGFFSNLGTNFYVGQRGVFIDPSINTNPQNISVYGTINQGYQASSAQLFQDSSSGHNNTCLEAGAPFTLCGTGNPGIYNDDGQLAQFNDCGGPCVNFESFVASVTGTGIKSLASGADTNIDFTLAAKGTGNLILGVSTNAIKFPSFAGGGTLCLHTNNTGVVTPASADCGSGGGSGTVTSASVVTANGFSGTVATATTTPAITLSTTASGLLKGSSGALAAATSGDVYALWSGTCSSTTFLRGDGACAAVGSSVTFQVNGTNLSSSSTVNFENGAGILVTNPSAGNVQISGTAPSRTVTSSPTVASGDMGGTLYMNVSGGGTLTIPAISSTVLASGMTVQVTNYAASTAALSTTPTVNAGGGCVSGTGIPAGDTWQIQSNGTTLDCVQSVPSAGGSGTVTTTGSPASGNLTKFSGTTSVTNGDLSGDVTTSGTLAATVVKVNGGAVPASAALIATNSSSQPTAVTVGTGVITALGVNTGSAGAVVVNGGSLGTPSSGSAANLTSLPVGGIAAIGADTLAANATGSSASPTAYAVGSLNMTILGATTTFTVAGTGCTPSAHAGTAFAGSVTLASGPCTSLTITMNGATGFTTTNGYHCNVGDKTLQNAGTWFGSWLESASNTTTATIPIPAAAGATDVITFACTPY